MAAWKTITFKIPDVDSFSDEDFEQVFMGRDGRWSRSIKENIKSFDAKGLDLDANWASRPVDWACPICGRRKDQLLRLMGENILFARLDVHHDHLEDYIKAKLREIYSGPWPKKIPTGTYHIENVASDMIARFARHVVCVDCNGAEARVKRTKQEIHRFFSFSPSEIAKFIKAAPNKEHDVDANAAFDLWRSAEANFNERLKIANIFVDSIVRGVLARESGNLPAHGLNADMQPIPFLHHWFSWTTADGMSSIGNAIRAVERRSVSLDGVGAKSKTKITPKSVTPPTDQELTEYDGGGALNFWQAAGETWFCPVCQRSKRDILRRSKNKSRRWSGKLQEHQEYHFDWNEDEDDPQSWIDGHRTLLICSDCAEIKAELKRRDPSLSGTLINLQIRDLRQIFTATPNLRHVVEWDAAVKLALSKAPWNEQVAQYWSRYEAAIGCRQILTELLADERNNHKNAHARLIAHYSRMLPEWSSVEVEKYVEHLLNDADQLAPEIE